jgi:predicted enzyme related to lactoylglutathione lyase
MLNDAEAFNSFAVDDLANAQQFYAEALRLEVETFEDGAPFFSIKLPGGGTTMVYEKADNRPANHTVLNFKVVDLDAEVDELTSRGISFERYEDFDQDEKGISEGGGGPRIAWFKDPAGNTIGVLEEG